MNSDNKKEPMNSSTKNYLKNKIQLNPELVNNSEWTEIKINIKKLFYQVKSSKMKNKLLEIISLITKHQDLRADIRRFK